MINWSGYNWIPRERWGLIHRKKVRVLKDKKILDQFNLSKMNLIINNHITSRYDLKNVKKSVFTINYFKYDKY